MCSFGLPPDFGRSLPWRNLETQVFASEDLKEYSERLHGLRESLSAALNSTCLSNMLKQRKQKIVSQIQAPMTD